MRRLKIEKDEDKLMWRDHLIKYCRQFFHPAWGISHSRAVLELTKYLAREEKVEIDEEALFAAAYLHDLGALKPFKEGEKEHSSISAQIAEEWLSQSSFPANKVDLVQKVIEGHMFYAKPAEHKECILFHDADVLEFLGNKGIYRLYQILGQEEMVANEEKLLGVIKHFVQELPGALKTESAIGMAKAKVEEMKLFLQSKGVAEV